jgi:transposase
LQSGHEPGHGSFQVIDDSVSRLDASPATPRRRWSAAAKERIVAEAMMPGANVSAVARSHGLSPLQVFTWRRDAVRRARQAGAAAETAAFAVVEVDEQPPSSDAIADAGACADGVELTVGDVTLRLGPQVPASRVRDLLRAVRSA